jgi:transposase
VRCKRGRPRRRPDRVTADRGYDADGLRRQLRCRGIAPEIARRKTTHGSGLGRARWVVERTFAWLHNFKRLLVRYDRRHEIHEAFLAIGCCLVPLQTAAELIVIRLLRVQGGSRSRAVSPRPAGDLVRRVRLSHLAAPLPTRPSTHRGSRDETRDQRRDNDQPNPRQITPFRMA